MSKKKNKTKISLQQAASCATQNITHPTEYNSTILHSLYKKELVEKRTIYDPSIPLSDYVKEIILERITNIDDYFEIADNYTRTLVPNYDTAYGISDKFAPIHIPEFTPFSKKSQIAPFPYNDDFRQKLLICPKYRLQSPIINHGTNGRKTELSTFYIGEVDGQLVLFRETIYRQTENKRDPNYTEANNSYALQAIIAGNKNGLMDLIRIDYAPTNTHYNRLAYCMNANSDIESADISTTHSHVLNRLFSIVFPTYYNSCEAEAVKTDATNFDDFISEVRLKYSLDATSNVIVSDRDSLKSQFIFFMKKKNNLVAENVEYTSSTPVDTTISKKIMAQYVSMYMQELSGKPAQYDLSLLPLTKKSAQILQHRIDNLPLYEQMADDYIKNHFEVNYKTVYGISQYLTKNNFPELPPFERKQQIFPFPYEKEFRENCINCDKYQIFPTKTDTRNNKVQYTTYYMGIANGQPCLFCEIIRHKVDGDNHVINAGYSYSLSVLIQGKANGYMELFRADFMPLKAHPNKMLVNGELNTYDNVSLYSPGESIDIVYGSHQHKLTKRYSLVFPAYLSASDAVDISEFVHTPQEMVEYARDNAYIKAEQPFMTNIDDKARIYDVFTRMIEQNPTEDVIDDTTTNDGDNTDNC